MVTFTHVLHRLALNNNKNIFLIVNYQIFPACFLKLPMTIINFFWSIHVSLHLKKRPPIKKLSKKIERKKNENYLKKKIILILKFNIASVWLNLETNTLMRKHDKSVKVTLFILFLFLLNLQAACIIVLFCKFTFLGFTLHKIKTWIKMK